jgi:hypothetical protein
MRVRARLDGLENETGSGPCSGLQSVILSGVTT